MEYGVDRHELVATPMQQNVATASYWTQYYYYLYLSYYFFCTLTNNSWYYISDFEMPMIKNSGPQLEKTNKSL